MGFRLRRGETWGYSFPCVRELERRGAGYLFPLVGTMMIGRTTFSLEFAFRLSEGRDLAFVVLGGGLIYVIPLLRWQFA